MTDKLEPLRSLQKRIRESKGADRRLDGDIAKAFGLPHGYREWIEYRIYYDTNEQAARVTSSLDACVALMAAVLPGCEWSRELDGGFRIFRNSPVRALYWLTRANVPALATDCHTFLDAIVSAALAEEEAKEAV